MSTKARGTTIEKTVETFSRLDIDEKMKAFEQMKDILNQEIEEKVNKLTGFAAKNTTK